MRSIISSRGQIIDNRKLIMRIGYYSLTLKKVHELANEFYFFVNKLFPDCVFDWKLQNRAFKDFNDALRDRSMKNGSYSLFMRGNFICEEVYNKTTFRRFERETSYPKSSQSLRGADESIDYLPYKRERSSVTWDVQREKEAALEQFDLEGKRYLAESVAPDVLAEGVNIPMDFSKPLFYGFFLLQIPVFCLENETNQIADRLLQFCLELEETFKKINAYVELNPRKECYSMYFGLFAKNGFASELPYRGISRCLYFPEFGWGNVISSVTRELKTQFFTNEEATRISVNETRSGGLCVRCCNPIMEMSIADLKSIKSVMYEYILPRHSIWKGICDFRKEWELVPIFNNELTVYNVGFVFQHYGTLDYDLFRELIMRGT